MAITLKHDAPGLVAAFAAGQAKRRDKLSKYGFDMVSQQQTDQQDQARHGRDMEKQQAGFDNDMQKTTEQRNWELKQGYQEKEWELANDALENGEFLESDATALRNNLGEEATALASTGQMNAPQMEFALARIRAARQQIMAKRRGRQPTAIPDPPAFNDYARQKPDEVMKNFQAEMQRLQKQDERARTLGETPLYETDEDMQAAAMNSVRSNYDTVRNSMMPPPAAAPGQAAPAAAAPGQAAPAAPPSVDDILGAQPRAPGQAAVPAGFGQAAAHHPHSALGDAVARGRGNATAAPITQLSEEEMYDEYSQLWNTGKTKETWPQYQARMNAIPPAATPPATQLSEEEMYDEYSQLWNAGKTKETWPQYQARMAAPRASGEDAAMAEATAAAAGGYGPPASSPDSATAWPSDAEQDNFGGPSPSTSQAPQAAKPYFPAIPDWASKNYAKIVGGDAAAMDTAWKSELTKLQGQIPKAAFNNYLNKIEGGLVLSPGEALKEWNRRQATQNFVDQNTAKGQQRAQEELDIELQTPGSAAEREQALYNHTMARAGSAAEQKAKTQRIENADAFLSGERKNLTPYGGRNAYSPLGGEGSMAEQERLNSAWEDRKAKKEEKMAAQRGRVDDFHANQRKHQGEMEEKHGIGDMKKTQNELNKLSGKLTFFNRAQGPNGQKMNLGEFVQAKINSRELEYGTDLTKWLEGERGYKLKPHGTATEGRDLDAIYGAGQQAVRQYRTDVQGRRKEGRPEGLNDKQWNARQQRISDANAQSRFRNMKSGLEASGYTPQQAAALAYSQNNPGKTQSFYGPTLPDSRGQGRGDELNRSYGEGQDARTAWGDDVTQASDKLPKDSSSARATSDPSDLDSWSSNMTRLQEKAKSPKDRSILANATKLGEKSSPQIRQALELALDQDTPKPRRLAAIAFLMQNGIQIRNLAK